MKILIIEDDTKIANIIKRVAQEAGYASDISLNGQEALTRFAVNRYDLIILDLMFPGIKGGGIELCRQIRSMDNNVPILMLTALDSPAHKVVGLDAGADDYLSKPFHINELQARIRALLRRSPRSDGIYVTIGDIRLDSNKRQVIRAGRTEHLSAREFAILEYLLKHVGRTVNQTELIEHIWDSSNEIKSNIVESHIRYLRKKLRRTGKAEVIKTEVIKTVRRVGYIIERNQ